GVRRQLARLAHDGDPDAERVGQRRADDEAARLDTEHHVGRAAIALGQVVDGPSERRPVGQQRRDVLEDDARLGEVRNVADVALQLHAHPPPPPNSVSGAPGSRARKPPALPGAGKNCSGSYAELSLRTSKWRFGPVARPDCPTLAISWPQRTRT